MVIIWTFHVFVCLPISANNILYHYHFIMQIWQTMRILSHQHTALFCKHFNIIIHNVCRVFSWRRRRREKRRNTSFTNDTCVTTSAPVPPSPLTRTWPVTAPWAPPRGNYWEFPNGNFQSDSKEIQSGHKWLTAVDLILFMIARHKNLTGRYHNFDFRIFSGSRNKIFIWMTREVTVFSPTTLWRAPDRRVY